MNTYSLFKLHTNLAPKTWITTNTRIPPHFEVFGYVDADSFEEAVDKWARKIHPNAKSVKVNLDSDGDTTGKIYAYTFEVEE